jgi:hypothetical protein
MDQGKPAEGTSDLHVRCLLMAMTPANVYLEGGGWLGSAISFLAVSPIFGYSIYRILSAEEKRRLKQDSASEAASR